MKNLFLLISFLFTQINFSFGQTKILKGAVFNEKGNPLVAASIIAFQDGRRSFGGGTSSKKDGTFILKIPIEFNGSILCTYIGYENQIVKIEGSDSINITLRLINETSFNFLKEDSSETRIIRFWGNPKKVKKVKRVSKVIKETVSIKASLPPPPPEEDYIFQKVEINAEYPRGQKRLMEYFEKSIIYPRVDTLKNVDGTVIAGFTIGKDGKAYNFKIIKSVNKFANEAVLNALEKMTKWTPAIQNGYTIEQYFEFSFKFKIKNTVIYSDDGKPSQ
jgi:TonB family protein